MTQTQYRRTNIGINDFSEFMYQYSRYANKGFTYTDIDGVLRNYTKKSVALLEIKCKNAQLTYCQTCIQSEFNTWLTIGTAASGWAYHGYHSLVFENTCFENGKAWLNGEIVTEFEFISWLGRLF
jgi:uncharacterized protein YuzB (UPF0349 family)